MSDQENGSHEAKSDHDEPETLDFLKDELEAANTEHFSFGKHEQSQNNEEDNSNQQEKEVREPATEAINQLNEGAAEEKATEANEKRVESNGQQPEAVSVEPPNKPQEPSKQTVPLKDSVAQKSIVPKPEELPKVNVDEMMVRPPELAVTPERPPKKSEVADNIGQDKLPVQAVSEQRAPKPTAEPTKSIKLKTEPAEPSHSALSKIDELRHLAKTNFQKKRETYTKLKEWDERRAEDLAIHRAVVEELQASIDRTVKSSLDNLQIYISFLREKSKQLEKYATHPAVNTRGITQNNEASKGIYINCALLLNSLSDESAERCMKAQNFSQRIRKNILTENLEEHLKKTQLELMKIRQKISTLKAALQKCNAETEERTVRLATQFNADASNISLQTERDFYKSQLSFLRKAREQTRVQKRLGELTFDYLQTATDEEYRRADAIKKAITLYVDGLRTSCDVEFDQESLEQLRKHEEEKLIPEFYALEELLDGKLLHLVKERMKLGDKDFDVEVLKQFLDGLAFADFDSSLLKVRQFDVSHEVARNKIEVGRLLVTVDNFVLLFLESENTQLFSKPAALFKIDRTLILTPKGDLSLELKKKEEKKGVMSYLIWDTKTQPTFTVRFRTPQDKADFEALVRRLY